MAFESTPIIFFFGGGRTRKSAVARMFFVPEYMDIYTYTDTYMHIMYSIPCGKIRAAPSLPASH
jgi:hypothetical protein